MGMAAQNWEDTGFIVASDIHLWTSVEKKSISKNLWMYFQTNILPNKYHNQLSATIQDDRLTHYWNCDTNFFQVIHQKWEWK